MKTISLKAALSGQSDLNKPETDSASEKQLIEEDVIDPSWNNRVSEDDVKKEWLNYMRQVESNNPRLASIMNNHLPELRQETILFVRLKNATQNSELNAEKTKLFGFLKRQLKNANLSLETEIVSNEQHEKKAFTAAERAKLMAEKNPDLLLFTKKFDLDVEI